MSTQEFNGQERDYYHKKTTRSDSDIILKQNDNRKKLTKCEICKKKLDY